MQKGLKEDLVKKFGKGATAKIYVAEPTIAATMNLYTYTTSLYKDIKIGYSAESIIRYDDKTEIVYCVGPHLKNKMLTYFDEGKPTHDIDFCHVLVLDECHRGTLDYEMIIGLWGIAHKAGRKVPKIILMSATLSMKELGLEGFKVVTANYKPFTIETEYSTKNYKVDAKDLYDDVVRLILEEHITDPIKPKGIDEDDTKKEGRTVNYPGYDVWIVFCPGEGEVMSSVRKLEEQYEASTRKKAPLQVVAAYGKMGSESYKNIFEPPEIGTRRVIFCTNIIEASVTIEFASRVFDLGREKYNATTSSGASCLILGFVSKSSADQRRGRTGRVCPGKCWRAMTEEQYNKLSEQRVPEAQRVPLHNVIIELMNVGLDPKTVLRGRINEENLAEALSSLLFLEMIDSDGKVTGKGRFAALFPLSVYASAMLYGWCTRGYNFFTGIVIICLIDGFEDGYFFYPNKDKMAKEGFSTAREYFQEYFEVFAGKTDLESLLIMWHHLIYAFRTLIPKKWALSAWCRKHSLNRVRISNALGNMSRLVKIFHRIRIKELQDDGKTAIQNIETKGFNISDAIFSITPILRKVYANKICTKRERGNDYRCGRLPNLFQVSDRSPLTATNFRFTEIIPLKINTSSTETTGDAPSKRGGFNYINFYAPISGDYLPEQKEIMYNKSEKARDTEEEDTDEEDEEAVEKAMQKKVSPSKQSLNRRKITTPSSKREPSRGRKVQENRRIKKVASSSDSSSTSPPPKPKKRADSSSSSPEPSKVIFTSKSKKKKSTSPPPRKSKTPIRNDSTSPSPRKSKTPIRNDSTSPPPRKSKKDPLTPVIIKLPPRLKRRESTS
jgi:hypothetical protein